MEWVKAFHVISVIAWMAGLMYLPRLFVYHAMIATWIFGLWLAFGFGLVDFSMGWMWLKALMVIALSGVQGFYGSLLRAFQQDRNTRSHKFFRAINEVPFVMAIIIVIAVIVKPF